MPRPRKFRNIGFRPGGATRFIPDGVGRGAVSVLELEELEAIRLKDIECLDQNACAEAMQISRPTFQRILLSAQRKIAIALVEGNEIMINPTYEFETENQPGRGMGQGRGQGVGRGQGTGRGMGQGQGRGQGAGRGQGMGTGQGRGLGAGRGQGRGMGQGRGQVTGGGQDSGMGNGLGLGSEGEK